MARAEDCPLVGPGLGLVQPEAARPGAGRRSCCRRRRGLAARGGQAAEDQALARREVGGDERRGSTRPATRRRPGSPRPASRRSTRRRRGSRSSRGSAVAVSSCVVTAPASTATCWSSGTAAQIAASCSPAAGSSTATPASVAGGEGRGQVVEGRVRRLAGPAGRERQQEQDAGESAHGHTAPKRTARKGVGARPAIVDRPGGRPEPPRRPRQRVPGQGAPAQRQGAEAQDVAGDQRGAVVGQPGEHRLRDPVAGVGDACSARRHRAG